MRRKFWATKVACAGVLAHLLLAASVHAAPPEAQPEADCGSDPGVAAELRAFDCQSKGKQQYDKALFREALRYFTKARSLFAQPAIVRSIARTCEQLASEKPDTVTLTPAERDQKLADLVCAADGYGAYLAALPDAPDAAALRLGLTGIRRRIDALKAPPPTAPKPPETPPTDAAKASPYPWVVHGAGLAGVTAGVVLGVLSQARLDEAKEPSTSASKVLELQQQHEDLALAANVSFGVGGGLALGGLVWGIVDLVQLRGSPRRPAAGEGLVLLIGASTIGLGGRF
jgi:hypothetical protein